MTDRTKSAIGIATELASATRARLIAGQRAVRFDLRPLNCPTCNGSGATTELVRLPASLSCEPVAAADLMPDDQVLLSAKCPKPECRRVWYVRLLLRGAV